MQDQFQRYIVSILFSMCLHLNWHTHAGGFGKQPSSQDTKLFRGYIWILLGIRVFCDKVMQNVGKVKMRCNISNVCSMHGMEK